MAAQAYVLVAKGNIFLLGCSNIPMIVSLIPLYRLPYPVDPSEHAKTLSDDHFAVERRLGADFLTYVAGTDCSVGGLLGAPPCRDPHSLESTLHRTAVLFSTRSNCNAQNILAKPGSHQRDATKRRKFPQFPCASP